MAEKKTVPVWRESINRAGYMFMALVVYDKVPDPWRGVLAFVLIVLALLVWVEPEKPRG